MNRIIVAAFIVLAAHTSPSLAECGNAASYLTRAQVNTILRGNFACGRSTAVNAPGWNERHRADSTLVETHGGGAADAEIVGNWTTANVSGRGRVTYAYTGGVTPVYEVAVATGNCITPACTTLPQTYQFCGVGGGAPASLNILVTETRQNLSGCPINP